jgi:predicted nucleotidyltransferase
MAEFVVVYETVHGSRAYGLAGDDSDLDLKGVIVGPSRVRAPAARERRRSR